MVEIILALGSGALVGFVFGSLLADRPHKVINERLSDEITFLRGILDRRGKHEERIERVKHGLAEVSNDDRFVEDPIPRDFLDLLNLFPNTISKTLSWARKLRRQHVPWEKIVQLYKDSIEEQMPGFFEMKAIRDAQRRKQELPNE